MSNNDQWISKHPLYKTWSNIRQRCLKPTNPSYPHYGGRGIKMHSDWENNAKPFIAWLEDNLGPKPEGFTLDRIDVDGDYVPGNLRWADWKTQRSNQRARPRPRRQIRTKPSSMQPETQEYRVCEKCREGYDTLLFSADSPACLLCMPLENLDMIIGDD